MTLSRRMLSIVLLLSLLTPAFAVDTAAPPLSVVPVAQDASWALNWWMPRHEQKLAEIKQRGDEIKVVFIGDSITHHWEDRGKKVWAKYYDPRGALNLGFSGDRTEHVLWRLQHGEIDGIHPKLVVMMIGTNNTGQRMDRPADIAAGIKADLDALRQRLPDTKILLLGIFPCGATTDNPRRVNNGKTNEIIKHYADDEHIYWLNIGKTFLTEDGTLTKQIMPDMTHPSKKGYELWAEAIEPTVKKLMGEKQ